jgi:hypothetical protein
MLCKTILALAATVTLGAAALAPNAASAWGGHGGGHGGWHGGGWHAGWRGPVVGVYAGPVYGGCTVQRWFYTPYGPALRWVNRCY